MVVYPRRPLRLAMFTERTRKNGSSRVVCYQYEKYLRLGKIDVHFYPPSSISLYEYFYERPNVSGWRILVLKAVYWYSIVLPNRLVQILRSPRYDLIFLQRGLLKWDSLPFLDIFLWVVAKGVCKRLFVYALDDAMYLDARWQYQTRIRLADWVYTGNPHIAEHARLLNPSVMVFESVVDLEFYRPISHREHQPIVIGWAGTILSSDVCPLRLVAKALERVSKLHSVVVHVVSDKPWQPDGLEVTIINIRWDLTNEVEYLSKFDIGIMPVENDEYGKAKEGYKLKTYMAMGLPVVCSAVGKNAEIVEDGVTGYLAASDEEWVDGLCRFITSYELRAQMGRAGRARVEERYSLSKAGPRLVEWLRSIHSSSRPPSVDEGGHNG